MYLAFSSLLVNTILKKNECFKCYIIKFNNNEKSSVESFYSEKSKHYNYWYIYVFKNYK